VWGFYRGKAAGAFAEAGVVDEASIMGDALPLEVTRAAVLVVKQFLRMLRW